jgi:hypothetical protein
MGWPRPKPLGRCARPRGPKAPSTGKRRIVDLTGLDLLAVLVQPVSERVLLPPRGRDPDDHGLRPGTGSERHRVPKAFVRLNGHLIEDDERRLEPELETGIGREHPEDRARRGDLG